jgi:hypothetical protein
LKARSGGNRRKLAEIGRKPLKRRLPHPFGAGGMGVAAMQ